jgi:glutathione S-transferase
MRTLVTVPFSHFCEKARWALDAAGLPYVEDAHLPMLHWAATFRAGGGRTVPVLVTEDGTLSDSTDILRHADRHAPPDRRLLPDDPRERTACDALEDELDESFAPAARRVGYYYCFSDDALILEIVARAAVPEWQRVILRRTLPLARFTMFRAMAIDERTVAESLDVVRRWFDDVAGRLRDGRTYLLGDRFSAADLTFAAFGAPMVAPREHPFPFPVEIFPPRVTAVMHEMSAHPTGAFISRLYAEHRHPERRSMHAS